MEILPSFRSTEKSRIGFEVKLNRRAKIAVWRAVMDQQLSNKNLIRYWVRTKRGYGIGVTAYSRDDAEFLIQQLPSNIDKEILEIIEDIDIQTLDQGHVIPNMRPPNWRGVWFPNIAGP